MKLVGKLMNNFLKMPNTNTLEAPMIIQTINLIKMIQKQFQLVLMMTTMIWLAQLLSRLMNTLARY